MIVTIPKSAPTGKITLAGIREMLEKAWTLPPECPICMGINSIVEIEKKGFFRKRYALLTRCFDCGRIIQREEIRRSHEGN